MASKTDETRDVLLDAIRTTTERVDREYVLSAKAGTLKSLALAYRYVVGGPVPDDDDAAK